MRIGIDARYYGNKHTGIGRYVQNLILNLAKIDRKNNYVVFGGEDVREDIKGFSHFEWLKLNTPPYSIVEQIVNPLIFASANLDLLHVPHFNAPILYPGKYIITVHDLIKHLSVGKNTTTLPYPQYLFKHFGYRLVVRANLLRAEKIIVPANFWQEYLINNFGVPREKIFVTYEAVAKTFTAKTNTSHTEVLNQYGLNQPFVIYTGNLYPHKNVPFLIEGLKLFNSRHEHHLELALACARTDAFSQKVKVDNTIKFLGYVPDANLSVLYHEALALIQPSLIEGFGLTGLEAMSQDLPVLSSNATCLPEIYGPAALYFDPRDLNDFVVKLEMVFSDQELVARLIAAGKTRLKQFSWTKTARQTLAVYQSSLVSSDRPPHR